MAERANRVFLMAAAVSLAGCSAAMLGSHPVAIAAAALADSAGRTVATANMWQEANGLVHVEVVSLALPAGEHGLHFHAVGTCSALPMPMFSSAGGHFNPLNKQHGLSNSAGPHAGDNPNLTVDASGTGKTSFTTDRVTLTAGPTSLFDSDGSALVIHAGPDDQMSQPAGNSGGRIACGVVKVVR